MRQWNVLMHNYIDASASQLNFVAAAGVISLLLLSIEVFLMIVKIFKHRWWFLKETMNYLEFLLFTSSIIFVSVFFTNCFCPEPWQWQIGSLSLFMGWLALIRYLKKFPEIGVYPFMYLNISWDYLKMALLAILLILCFSFPFFMLFYDPDLSADNIVSIILVMPITSLFR